MAGVATATVRAAKGRRLIPTRAALVLVSVAWWWWWHVCQCSVKMRGKGRNTSLGRPAPHPYTTLQSSFLRCSPSPVCLRGLAEVGASKGTNHGRCVHVHLKAHDEWQEAALPHRLAAVSSRPRPGRRWQGSPSAPPHPPRQTAHGHIVIYIYNTVIPTPSWLMNYCCIVLSVAQQPSLL